MSLSAPVAFVDGVIKQIPFNRIDYIKGDLGDLTTGPSGVVFTVGPGLYLVQGQLVTSVALASLVTVLLAVDGTRAEQAESIQRTPVARSEAMLNALLPKSDLPAQVSPFIFAAVAMSMVGAGASGNINSASMLIQRISSL